MYQTGGVLAALDGDAVSVVLVVKTRLTSENFQSFVIVDLTNTNGVGDVDVKVFEVSQQFVNFDIFNFNTWEFEVLLGVQGKILFVGLEEFVDAVKHSVVHGITEHGVVVSKGAGGNVVLVVGVQNMSKKVEGVVVDGTVVFGVDGIAGLFDYTSQSFSSLFGVDGKLFTLDGLDVSTVDGITNSIFQILDTFEVGQVKVTELDVFWTRGNGFTVLVTEVGVVGNDVRVFVGEVPHLVHVVGVTFKSVTSKKLLVMKVEEFSLTIIINSNVFLVEPVGVAKMVHVVVEVVTDIFNEVRGAKFRVVSVGPTGVVGVQNEGFLVASGNVLHAGVIGPLNGFGVDVKMRANFIEGRNNNSLGVGTVEESDGQSVDEESVVDVFPHPRGGAQEGVPVLGVEKDIDDSLGLLSVGFVEGCEDLRTVQNSSGPVHFEEMFNNSAILEVVDILFEVVVGGEVLQFRSDHGLVDVNQELEDGLLFGQEFLVSCK